MNSIGVDLHRKSVTVCVMDQNRKVLARKSIDCKQTDEIVEFFRLFRPFQVVVEATASSPWFQSRGKDTHCISMGEPEGHAIQVSRPLFLWRFARDPVHLAALRGMPHSNFTWSTAPASDMVNVFGNPRPPR